jgi:hypothetical protein
MLRNKSFSDEMQKCNLFLFAKSWSFKRFYCSAKQIEMFRHKPVTANPGNRNWEPGPISTNPSIRFELKVSIVNSECIKKMNVQSLYVLYVRFVQFFGTCTAVWQTGFKKHQFTSFIDIH